MRDNRKTQEPLTSKKRFRLNFWLHRGKNPKKVRFRTKLKRPVSSENYNRKIKGIHMINPTRRLFLKQVALTGTAFYVPRLSIAQQNWQVQTVAGTGVAGYEFEGRD